MFYSFLFTLWQYYSLCIYISGVCVELRFATSSLLAATSKEIPWRTLLLNRFKKYLKPINVLLLIRPRICYMVKRKQKRFPGVSFSLALTLVRCFNIQWLLLFFILPIFQFGICKHGNPLP